MVKRIRNRRRQARRSQRTAAGTGMAGSRAACAGADRGPATGALHPAQV
jgi:hypothetical protein